MISKPFKPLTIKRPGDVQAPSDAGAMHPPAKRQKIETSLVSSRSPTGASERLPSLAEVEQQQYTFRTPLHAINNETVSIAKGNASVDVGIRSYYSILWRPFTAKKNKTWTGDGALGVSDGSGVMYDSSGKCLGRIALNKPLLPGSILSISGKEVEIDSCISRENFLKVIRASKKPECKDDATSNHQGPKAQAAKPTSLPVRTSPSKPKLTIKQDSTYSNTESRRAQDVPKQFLNSTFRQPLKESTVMASTSSSTPQPRHDPKASGALVFKQPKTCPPGKQLVDVVLDPLIGRLLREHQREGIEFLYECVMGLRDFNGQGCILADDMGLGKTLQIIALLWTLIKQNPIHGSGPVVRRALVVCPVTLRQNWKREFNKWLGADRLGVLVFDDSKTRLSAFDGKAYNVMIIGYERLRSVAEDLTKRKDIDLVICDEGHRLKTVDNKAAKAIELLNTPRRVILSGTPIQNDLGEFFSMVNFVNDGCVGTRKAFQKNFENKILKSRQPDATLDDIEIGEAASEELAQLTSPFILRRTAEVLSRYLPPKTEYVLFCNPTPQQAHIYREVVQSPMFQNALGSSETALELITILKKLCNSPALMEPKSEGEAGEKCSLSNLNSMLPPKLAKLYRNSASIKLRLLDLLLQEIRKTNEKVVLASNYTSTLDLMQKLLESSSLPFSRLDGTVPPKKRQALVDEFNHTGTSRKFAFLLSVKAGGVGINLHGASRLILFDIDWNPAADDQAMARIHREGQKNHCRIYRFLIKGALEERIWQRQIVKRGLANSIMDGNAASMQDTGGNTKTRGGKAAFSQEELKDLFRLDEAPGLRTHDLISCPCGGRKAQHSRVDDGTEEEAATSTAEDASESDEELPSLTGIITASQLTRRSNFETNQLSSRSRTTSSKSRSRSRSQSPRKKQKHRELHDLMAYSHVDTSNAPSLAEGSEELEDMETIIDDPCLMKLLMAGHESIGPRGGVKYVFCRTGSSADADAKKEVEVEDIDLRLGLLQG